MPRKKLTPEQKAEAEAKAVAILAASSPPTNQRNGAGELVTRMRIDWPEMSKSGPKKSMMNALAACFDDAHPDATRGDVPGDSALAHAEAHHSIGASAPGGCVSMDDIPPCSRWKGQI